ncbi:MAG: hypothetical protein Q4C96_01985 [Planctomycetia bacterium]|nr:hypothetical protein [Planctomycetia bacterium]
MGLFFSRKKSRVAVLVHDGEQWYGYVMTYARPRWRREAEMKCPGKNPRQIPPGLLDFAEKNNAARIRILVSSELITLPSVEFPPDLSPEEMQMVVQGVMSEQTDLEIGTVRVAAAYAERFHMGAPQEMLLVASFENALLETFEKNCRTIRIPLEGIGCLEMALLGAHARENADRRFLFLKRDSGFYVTHATDFLPMSVNALPLGALEDTRGRESERLQRAGKRLESQKDVPLSVLSAFTISEDRRVELNTVFGENTDVKWTEYSAFLQMAAEEVAQAEYPGAPDGGGAVCGLGEEDKDPYIAGTWLFFLVIILAVVFVWGAHMKLQRELEGIERKSAAWKALQEERKKQNDILKKIDSERTRYEKITAILQDKNVFPPGFMEILNVLNEKMPPYTRLNSIHQLSPGGYALTGCTRYQEGLMEMIPMLNTALQSVSYVAELSKLEKREESREQDFLIRITPQKK